MSGLHYIILAEVVLMLALAGVLMLSSRKKDTSKRIIEHFALLAIEVDKNKIEIAWRDKLRKLIGEIFIRAGISLSGRRWWPMLVTAVLLIGVVTVRYGAGAGFVALSAIVLMVYAFLQFRYRQRAEALLSQLPRFIDSLERSLGTGRSLQAALSQATDRAAEPLHSVLLRVRHNVEFGGDLGEQLQNAANTMAVKEFQLLALAVNVHHRYGGSIKELLHSITTMVRQREQARREFAALTSETRFSAWVIGGLPLVIAGYMALANPGYISTMWNSETGRSLLYLAIGFQITGGLVLWRMIRSI